MRVALFSDAVAAVARSMSETPAARRKSRLLPALGVFRLEGERSESPTRAGSFRGSAARPYV